MKTPTLASFEAPITAERRLLIPPNIRRRLGIKVHDHLSLSISDFSEEHTVKDRFKVISNGRVTLEKKTHCVQLGVTIGDYVQVEILADSEAVDPSIAQPAPEVRK